MNQTKPESKDWFVRHAESDAKKDVLPVSERRGNIAGLIIIFLVFFFFVAHQVWQTGFFISTFVPVEMFLFYVSLLYGILTTTV